MDDNAPSLSAVLRGFRPQPEDQGLSLSSALLRPGRPIGGTHPDHSWDKKSGRWKDLDGKYLSGPPPDEK